jgi:hypothetical protein
VRKKESEKLILKDLHRKKETVSIERFPEKSISEDSEREEEILIKDTSGVKKVVDIKTEIKKPDIKLVGKIEVAVQNRKKLQELLVEAGRRYVNALKAQRKRR